MPILRSKAQVRWAHAQCKSGRGKTKKAACDAVREFHGRTTKGMPERKGKKRRARRKGSRS